MASTSSAAATPTRETLILLRIFFSSLAFRRNSDVHHHAQKLATSTSRATPYSESALVHSPGAEDRRHLSK
jgi:hypothetical protein